MQKTRGLHFCRSSILLLSLTRCTSKRESKVRGRASSISTLHASGECFRMDDKPGRKEGRKEGWALCRCRSSVAVMMRVRFKACYCKHRSPRRVTHLDRNGQQIEHRNTRTLGLGALVSASQRRCLHLSMPARYRARAPTKTLNIS